MVSIRPSRKKSFDLFSSHAYFVPGMKDILVLAGTILVGIALGNLATLLMAAVSDFETATTYGMILSYPLMFLPAMLYASFQSRKNQLFDTGYAVDSNNFGKIGGAAAALMAVVATLACSVLIDPISMLLPPMSDKWKILMESTTGGPLWVSIVSTVIFAPIFEEWLCRGMIMRGLMQKIHPAWAMMLSALFFALLHGNPWQALPAFIMGVLFAYVYYRTGSLRLTMLMHAANNAVAVILSRSEPFKSLGPDTSLLQLTDKWIYAVLLCASLFIIVIFIDILRKNIPLKSERGNCDEIILD